MKIIDEFLGREFPQNCGDSLLVLSKKEKDYYLCKFIKYPYELKAKRDKIKIGQVNNPQIEVEEFLNKIWPQKCGDSLKIIEKIPSKGRGKAATFKCKFAKYNIEIISQKHHIIKGEIYNQQIFDAENFIGKFFKQNCGNTLEVLEVIDKRLIPQENKYRLLYKCKFLNTNTIVIDVKESILKGLIDDKNFINYEKYPYKSKEKLISIIKELYPNKKPSLNNLAINLNIAVSTIGQAINEFGLRDLISWNFGKEEKEVREYCHSLDNSFLENSTFKELKNYEIDIYSPKLKLGFEFNGMYWHSDEVVCKNSKGKFKTSKEKDNFKYNLAKEKEIDLYFIKEEDWLNNKEEVKERIKHIIYEYTR